MVYVRGQQVVGAMADDRVERATSFELITLLLFSRLHHTNAMNLVNVSLSPQVDAESVEESSTDVMLQLCCVCSSPMHHAVVLLNLSRSRWLQ